MTKLVNRAKMTTNTTGTGLAITLDTTAVGYQSFADAGVVQNDVVRYVIEDGSNWEIGLGTYTPSSAPNPPSLTRGVTESSNSGQQISLSGDAVVFLTAGAEDVFNDNYHPNADRWTTSRTISLSGDASGSVTLNGSSNVTLNVAVADDSHNHIISNIDGLQTSLNLKVNTSTQVTGSNGLTGGGALSGNVSIRHADTSTQSSVTNTGRTYIQGIQLDDYGHVTSISSATETAPLYSAGNGIDLNSNIFSVGAGGGLVQEPTGLAHADTSAQASLDALTGANVVSDINLDTYGHVTGLSTRTMTLSDLGYTGETNATADQTASEILTAIKTVDGSSSGLDADLLDGLDSTAFQKISDKEFFSITNTGTTSGVWTGTHPDITSYFDGMTIAFYQNNIAGATTTTLNINNLGAKTIYYANDEKLTTHYGPRALIMLQYDTGQDRFYAHDFYFSSTDYELRWQTDVQAGAYIHGYQLLLEGVDGKYYPVTEGGSTGNTNTVSTAEIRVGGNIIKYNYTTDYAADAIITANYLYTSLQTGNMEYWNNRDSGWATPYNPIYLVGTINSNGNFVLDNSSYTSFLTQDLPTTEDGKVYWYIGLMTDNYDDYRLIANHPMYIYKNGAVREWGQYASNSDKLDGQEGSYYYSPANAPDPTLTINGDASGSATFTNLGNATLTLTVADDSHTHDGRYYTETEADSRFVNVTGDTMSGSLAINANDASITLNDTSGSPTDQGIRIRAESLDVNLPGSEGLGIIFEESPTNGSTDTTPAVITTGEFYAQSNQKVFHDNYHPNADKWTTARTLSLSGDASGSVSWDGSADATLSVTVADDSHNHVWGNIDGGSVNAWGGLRHSTASGYIDFGPANTIWAHIYTDRPNFYFNKDLYVNNEKVWHAGNDGSGSGLDADLLDGQEGSYYYPASNPNGYTTYSADQALDTTSNPTFNNAYIAGVIYHSGDTDTYMQFHAADQWRVVTGGAERFEVNNSDVTVQSALKEKYVALSGTTPSIDVDAGGAFSLTTSGNTTFTFAAFTSALSSGFVLELTAGGAHTITWPTSVDWAGGTAPDAPASGEKNLYVFWSRDGGTTWYGVLSSAAAA